MFNKIIYYKLFIVLILISFLNINSYASKTDIDEITKNTKKIQFHAIEEERNENEIENNDSYQKIGFSPIGLIGLGVDFTLNVLGAPAAFWGATDAFYLRDAENTDEFRIAAIVIGSMAMTRYVMITAMNTDKYKNYLHGYRQGNTLSRVVKTLEDPVSALHSMGARLMHGIFPRHESSSPQGDSSV